MEFDEAVDDVGENVEPSLGWTEGEAAEGRTYAAPWVVPPKGWAQIDRPPLAVKNAYRRFLSELPAK
jgi:hypothetical protein